MKISRGPVYSPRTRWGFSPLLVTLVVGGAASGMDILGGFSDPVISLSVVVLTIAISLWSQIAGYRRTSQIQNRLSGEAPDHADRTNS